MKKIYMLLLTVTLAAASIAQVPDKMSYQAVIRDASGGLVTEQEIGMQISILQGTANGAAVYVETQTPVTNANGLVSIEIGGDDGTAISGNFASIDWSDGPYFIKTETDPSGETNYTITGTSQLLSVPYALHSGSSDALTGEITESQISDLQNYLTGEDDPLFDASPAAGIEDADISNWNEAHSWGDHAVEDYLTDITEQTISELSDIDITGLEAGMVLKYDADTEKWVVADDEGIIEETDPLFMESSASAIVDDDLDNWNEAHGWGDHAEAEYLTEETDPLFAASIASDITQENIESWDAKSEFDGEFSSLTGVPNSVIMPAGVINIFAGSTAPDGYLICDGSEVSRTEYADLFAVIGTTYGEGDGSTTFNLPDLQSRIPVGISAEPEFDELGKTGGAKEHVLTVNEMPAHSHAGSTGSAGNHTHLGTTNTTGAHTYSGTTGSSGYSGSSTIQQGIGANATVARAAGSHTHNLNISTDGAHSHSLSVSSAGAHTHSVSIDNTGGNNGHNNLQPYIVFNFIIKY